MRDSPISPDTTSAAIRRWGALAVAFLATALFLNVLPNTFMWDDWQVIFNNPMLRVPGGMIQIFNTNLWGFHGGATDYYRPLLYLTLYVALHWFGLNPAGYHLISILLHAVCTVLVLMLIRRWSSDLRTALFAALLFAAHPVHTENLCWISTYSDFEATLFVLLAVLIYTSVDTTGNVRPRGWPLLGPLAVGLCLFLGLLAKEIAVIVPVVCLAWEFFRRREGFVPTLLTILRTRWRDYLAMAGGLAADLTLRVHALGGLMPAPGGRLQPAVRLFTNLALIYRYLVKLVWPAQLTLFHDFPLSRTFWDWRVAAGLTTLALFVWLLVWLWRRRQPAALGLVILAAALAPALELPYTGYNLLAERYLYLPSLGFCWLIGWLFSEMIPRIGGRKVALLLAGLLAAYGLRTEARNLDWRAEIPFYQKSIAMAPSLAELHVLLGDAYFRREMIPQALQEMHQAAAMKPGYVEAINDLGQIYSLMNKPAEAAEQYRLAVADTLQTGGGLPTARAYNNLAYETSRLGKTDEAIQFYKKAIEIDPGFAGAHNNLGYLFLQQGQYQESEAELRRAMELEPALPQVASNLGLLYLRTGKLDLADRYLNDALRLEPRSGETYARLGELAILRGDKAQALALFQRALEWHPENQRAKEGLAELQIKNHKSKVNNQK